MTIRERPSHTASDAEIETGAVPDVDLARAVEALGHAVRRRAEASSRR